jgi:hypothetical protein
MKLKTIETSYALEPGQLVATRNGWWWFGSQSSAELESASRQFQFYRHRREPVPGVHRSKRRRTFRRPKTANERRAAIIAQTSPEFLGNLGAVYTVRRKRSACRLPDAYHDVFIRYQRTWKEHRIVQRKTSTCINR